MPGAMFKSCWGGSKTLEPKEDPRTSQKAGAVLQSLKSTSFGSSKDAVTVIASPRGQGRSPTLPEHREQEEEQEDTVFEADQGHLLNMATVQKQPQVELEKQQQQQRVQAQPQPPRQVQQQEEPETSSQQVVARPPPSCLVAHTTGVYTDAQWMPMLKYIETWGPEAVDAGADVLIAPRVPRPLNEYDPYAPKRPLAFAMPHWRYKPVDMTKFMGDWERDYKLSTPPPLPCIDVLQFNPVARSILESLVALTLRMSKNGQQAEMLARPGFIPPSLQKTLPQYVENYNLDGTESYWTLRRDVRPGRMTGEAYMTTDGVLIMRIQAAGVFSKKVEYIGEDYLRLEDNGKRVIVRMCAINTANGKTAHHYMIGNYKGPPGTMFPM